MNYFQKASILYSNGQYLECYNHALSGIYQGDYYCYFMIEKLSFFKKILFNEKYHHEAKNYFLKLHELADYINDAEVYWILGECFDYGYFQPQNPLVAQTFYLKSAQKGFYLAQCKLIQLGISEKSITDLKLSDIDHGATMIYEIGNQLIRKGLKRKSYKYFVLSAKKGNRLAYYQLAIMSFRNKKIKWLKKGARAGNSKCQYLLAQELITCKNKKKRRTAMKKFYSLLNIELLPNIEESKNICMVLSRNTNKSLDENDMEYSLLDNYFKNAKKFTISDSEILKVLINYNKEKGDVLKEQYCIKAYNEITQTKNAQEIIPLEIKGLLFEYIDARENNDGIAQYSIALYYKNQGNYEESRYWLEKATSNFNIDAVVALGEYYEKGIGGSRCLIKSLELYELAADHRNGYAMYRLAESYYHGEIRPRDVTKAFSYFNLANQNGYTNSKILEYGLIDICSFEWIEN